MLILALIEAIFMRPSAYSSTCAAENWHTDSPVPSNVKTNYCFYAFLFAS